MPNEARFSPASALSWLDSELAAFATVVQFAVRHGRQGHAVRLAAALHRYLEAGHGTEALAIYECAIEAAKATGDTEAEAHLRTNAGVIQRQLGRYPAAVAELERATALSNLGTALASLPHLERALEIFRTIKHRYGEASVLNAIGEVLHAAGRDGEAAQRHRHALAIATETGDEDERGRAAAALKNLAP